MSEGSQNQRKREQGIARIAVIMALVFVMTIGIASACIYYFWYDERTPELSANVMVPEAKLYASLNLRPEKSQLYKLQDIWERFQETEGLDESYGNLLNEFRDTAGIDFEDDLISWLEELAIGVTMDVNNPEDMGVVVLAGTSDKNASEIAIEKILDYAGDDADPRMEAEYRGYNYIFDEYDEAYLAVTEEYVVFCSSLDLLTDVIDLIADGGESLADQPKFQQAREEMPPNRIGFFYMDTEAMLGEAFESAMSDYEYGSENQEQMNLLEQSMPEYVVASMQCIDYGLKTDYYVKYPALIDPEFLTVENNDLKSMELIPADALGLISVCGISSSWEQQLSTLDEDMKQELDDAQFDIRRAIGYDLDEIFALFDSEIAITMLPGGMSVSSDDEFDGMPRIAALVEVKDREEMESFVNDMTHLLMEEGGVKSREIDLADEKAFIFSDISEEVSIGYMYLDDFLVIGMTQETLEQIVETNNNLIPSLAENNGMVRPFGMVKDTSSVFYLNIQGIINQVLELTPRETVETYDREVARYLEPFQTVMITGSGATEGTQLYSVGTFIITLSTSTATE